MTVVTPRDLRRATILNISRRTSPRESYCWKIAVIESMEMRLALYLIIAYWMRSISADRSKSPTTSCPSGSGEASRINNLPWSINSWRSQLKLWAFLIMSDGDSSKVTKTPCSSSPVIPLYKNCIASKVLPVPEVPLTRVDRPLGKPPWVISSSPSIMVRSFCTPSSCLLLSWLFSLLFWIATLVIAN